MIPAYVLHQRKYRETSLLVDLLTQSRGVIRVIAKGACHAKSPWRGILQSFIPLIVSWSARRELGTLTHAEIWQYSRLLQGDYLLSGLYINELIMRLIHPHAPVPELFTAYRVLHQQLVNASCAATRDLNWQWQLRLFEKQLLAVLGISLDFSCDCHTGELIQPAHYYRFVPEKGFIRSTDHIQQPIKQQLFYGESLLALASEQCSTQQTLRDAKRLMRLILGTLLGGRQLNSRALF